MDDSEKWKGGSDMPFKFLFGSPQTPEQIAESERKLAAAVMLAEVAYSTMPRYDHAESCAKCGSPRHRILYRGPGLLSVKFGKEGDGLVVECRRCQYKWYRRCIDAPEAA